MKHFTSKEMADMNDDKWLVVNGTNPTIHWDLKIDCLLDSGVVSHRVPAPAFWENITKYRLHNGPGYKDGIAIDEQAGCKITQRKEQGEWVDGSPPIGEVCEQEIIPGKWVPATVLFRNDLGCVIDTPYRAIDDNLRRTGSQSYYSCLVKLNFRPILTPKQRTIEAAAKVLQSEDADVTELVKDYQMFIGPATALYDAGLLMNGESND